MWQELQTAKVLILGCGNVLMGDDGFGPAVIRRLAHFHRLPPEAHAEDVGTSVREVLFNITVLPDRPDHVIVLDAVDKGGRKPGELFELSVDQIPEEKATDFSLHQMPTSNLLRELRDLCGVRVTVVAAQVGRPTWEVRPGLSEPMKAAVRAAAALVEKLTWQSCCGCDPPTSSGGA